MLKLSNEQQSKRCAVTIAITLEQAAALDRLLAVRLRERKPLERVTSRAKAALECFTVGLGQLEKATKRIQEEKKPI
jgi:hypothetical protein